MLPSKIKFLFNIQILVTIRELHKKKAKAKINKKAREKHFKRNEIVITWIILHNKYWLISLANKDFTEEKNIKNK